MYDGSSTLLGFWISTGSPSPQIQSSTRWDLMLIFRREELFKITSIIRVMSEMISSTPRKRTISEANNDSAVNREERMIADLAFDGQSSGGLRRRRIGDSENDAEASNGVANETSNEMREESVASQLHQTSVPLSPPKRQFSSLSSCLPPEHQKPVLPLSMQLMRPFWLMSCCPDCGRNGNNNEDFFSGNTGLHPRNISIITPRTYAVLVVQYRYEIYNHTSMPDQ